MLSVYTRHHPDCKNAGAALALTKSSMRIETVRNEYSLFRYRLSRNPWNFNMIFNDGNAIGNQRIY